jgi:hypothetical protein
MQTAAKALNWFSRIAFLTNQHVIIIGHLGCSFKFHAGRVGEQVDAIHLAYSREDGDHTRLKECFQTRSQRQQQEVIQSTTHGLNHYR